MKKYIFKLILIIGATLGVSAVTPWGTQVSAQGLSESQTLIDATTIAANSSAQDAIPAGTLLALIPFILDRAIKIVELILQNRRDRKLKNKERENT